MDHGTAQPQLVWSFLIFCLYLGGLGATLRILGKKIGLACIIDMGDKGGDIKQPHLILKMAPSSVIHHVKVDVNIISTK